MAAPPHTAVCAAVFNGASGLLVYTSPTFIDFCDMPRKCLSSPVTWRDLFDGSCCTNVSRQVAFDVQQSMRRLEFAMRRIVALPSERQRPETLLALHVVTRLGREKVRDAQPGPPRPP